MLGAIWGSQMVPESVIMGPYDIWGVCCDAKNHLKPIRNIIQTNQNHQENARTQCSRYAPTIPMMVPGRAYAGSACPPGGSNDQHTTTLQASKQALPIL